MRWSWKIARFAGIDIDVHATFLLLLAWVAFAQYAQGHSVIAAVQGVLFVLALFASVVLHEYGHALTARRYGVRTRGITLLPIGGVARLERMPDEPRQEFLIAIAGPAVTAGLVIVLYLALRLGGSSIAMRAAVEGTGGSFVVRLLWINVVLFLFNILPAFPMDGGRLLRAGLAMRTDYVRATALAAAVGKTFALLFAIFGLFVVGNPFLVLIALFVWFGAAAEASAAQFKGVASDVPVARAMVSEIQTLSPDERIAAAVEHVRSGFQHDFPVVHDHAVTGVLTRELLLDALAHGRENELVGDVMQRSFASTSPDESLEQAMARLQNCHCRTLPVLRGRELVGLLTADRISEFLMLESAMQAGHGHHG